MSSEPSSLAELHYTCPVCMDSLFSPVFQCRNGHLMCEGCSSRLKNCGVCRVTLPHRVRNLELEKIIQMMQHPCPNEIEGCQVKLNFNQMEAHRFECYYTKFPICELLFGYRDCEEVRICDYEEHYVKKHGRNKALKDTATLPVDRDVKLSRLDFDKCGFVTSFKVEFEKQTILFIVVVDVDTAHDRLKCKPWCLAGKAMANQLNCKISFSSGIYVKVKMDAPIFNLETKQEDLLACAGISWKYFQTNFPSHSFNVTGENRFRIKLSKKTGTLLNEQWSSAMDSSTCDLI